MEYITNNIIQQDERGLSQATRQAKRSASGLRGRSSETRVRANRSTEHNEYRESGEVQDRLRWFDKGAPGPTGAAQDNVQ